MKLIKFTLSRFLLCLSLISFWGIQSHAQDAEKLPKDPALAMGKLANGLTYYIRTNHKPEKKVELRLVVNAGSICEEDDQQGLAHFMEHMNFNGTKNFEKNDLVSYLQSIGVQFGADLNAYTSFDETVFILPIPLDRTENLDKGFQILEDWAHYASLTDQDIDDERGVVLEESRLGKGADDKMFRKYFPKLTDGTKYADRIPIGDDDIIKDFKYEKLKDFYNDWYRPDLQAVVVVGDVDTAVIKKMIIDHFEHLRNPQGEKRRKYESVKPRKEPVAMVVTDKEASNTSLSIIYPYIKKHIPLTVSDYKIEILRNLALGIINHRLADLANSVQPPFPYAIASFDETVHGYECLTFNSSFSKSGPDSALDAIALEILRLKKYGVSDTELQIVKKEVMAGMEKMYNERSTTDSRVYADECVRSFTDKEPIPGIENEYNYYKSMLPDVKVADINQLVKTWITSKNVFTLITAPDRVDLELPRDGDLQKMSEAAYSQTVTPTAPHRIPAALLEKKPDPGKVVSTANVDGLNATTYTLSNGIKVTIKPTEFKSDEIILTAVKKGGSNNYNLEDRSNVHFANDVVDNMGLANFTPSDLEKVLAGKNVSVKLSISDISDQIKASSSVKDFETMLQLLYLNLTNPRRDEGLFKAFVIKQKTSLEFMSANPRLAFIDTAVKELFDHNPLARMILPTAADYDKINMDRVLEIYRNEFSTADGYQFFIVGNVKPETVIPLIETYIGSLPEFHTKTQFKDNGVRPVKGNHEFEFRKGDENQSLIFQVFASEYPYSEEFALKLSALAEVLNIKVIEDLREKMGSVYTGGFNATATKEPYERYSMILQLPCGPENVKKLLNAVEHEIDSLKESGPDTLDISKVKSQWKEKHLTNVVENSYWSDMLEGVLFWGRSKDRVVGYDTFVDMLTAKDIQETAQKVFNGDNKFTAILKPNE